MDPITQGSLGAALAQVSLFSYDRKRAWVAGGLAGMAADLDIIIRSNSDPLLSLVYHRHFTHALSFIPVGALLVALFLLIFKSFRPQWHWVLIACLIGYASHGPLDALTSYGTVLFWPFSDRRVSLDLISIIDPFFTFPLILGLTWSIVFKERRAVIIGLSLAFLVIAFNAWQHHRVIHTIEQFAKHHDLETKKIRAFPALGSSSYWRVLFQYNHQFIMADVVAKVFSKPKIGAIGCFNRFSEQTLPDYISQSSTLHQDFQRFRWFTDDYLILVNKSPLQLADGRYIISNHPPLALWGVRFDFNQPHVRKSRLIKLENLNDDCPIGNWR